MFAAYKGYVQCVKDLIEEGDDVNQTVGNNRTAIILAAAGGYSSCVHKLIEAGADVNQADEDNFTAVTMAALGGYSSCVQLLLESGADVNMTGTDSITPCFAVVFGTQFDLAPRKPEINKKTTQSKQQLATCSKAPTDTKAIVNKQYFEQPVKDYGTTLKLLVAGAQRKIVYSQVMQAVLASVSLGNYRGLEMVLKAGFSVNTKTEYFPSPLIAAVGLSEQECEIGMKMLPECYVKVHHDHNKCLQILLQAGAKVNAVDDERNTALICAASNGYKQCVKTLLEAGASVNKRNTKGDTALMVSAAQNHSVKVRSSPECAQQRRHHGTTQWL